MSGLNYAGECPFCYEQSGIIGNYWVQETMLTMAYFRCTSCHRSFIVPVGHVDIWPALNAELNKHLRAHRKTIIDYSI